MKDVEIADDAEQPQYKFNFKAYKKGIEKRYNIK